MQKKLFLSFIIIILFLSFIIGFYSINICQSYYTNDYKEHLIKESNLLSCLFQKEYKNFKGKENFETFTNKFAKELQMRITIIDKNGIVLSDSQVNESALENHSQRREVIAAMNGEIGVESRYSQTLQTDYLYVARPVKIQSEIFILRVSVPLLELTAIKNQVMLYTFLGVFVAVSIAFLFAYYFSKKFSTPLDELTIAAAEISRGNYEKEILIKSDDQIGALTKAFNQMSKQLNETIHQLENENIKLESIVDSIIDAMIAIDNENKILMINSVCYKLFDIKIHDIIGYHFYDVIRNECVYKILESCMKEKKHIVDEFIFKSQLEGNKILKVYANPIASQQECNEIKGILLVFEDVTQVRKLEQLRSDFVSNVTHELKTPLTSIIGFTDTLKAGAIEDTQAAIHFIDIIEIEAKRLYRLILDILSLSELETRKEDINIQKENIKQMILNICDVLQPQIEKKGLELIVKIDENIPPFICNKDRVSQMLINLIDNAIKYTEKGHIQISCFYKKYMLEIYVEDTGIGIPKESIERIFERFYRVDKGRSRKAGGTGLGLSIVKHIVMLYEGKLGVSSEEGKGTIFMIMLPYKKEIL